MASISASWAGAAFLRSFSKLFPDRVDKSLPAFDARYWSHPTHDVNNYFLWRQQDCTRNSISALAQAHFSHKRLHGVTSSGKQDLLMLEKGINWNDCPTTQKRGACVTRVLAPGPNDSIRSKWIVDHDIPIFSQDRIYINGLLKREE